MERTIIFLVFLTIFFAILLMIHIYVFYRLKELFGIKKSIYINILILVLSLSFIIGNIAISSSDSLIARTIYYISSLWIGAVFLLLCMAFAQHMLSLIVPMKKKNKEIGIIIISAVFAITVYSVINAAIPQVTYINLETDKVTEDVTIVQISDVHLGPVNREGYLENILLKINRLNPDMVIVTGDLIDRELPQYDKILDPFTELDAPVYMSIGNHESYSGLEDIEPVLKEKNVKILRDAVAEYKGIQIAGIDDSDDPDEVIRKLEGLNIDENKYSILAYHRPHAGATRTDLVLSGHTHSGQIFPFHILVPLDNDFLVGMHKVNDTYMYVSHGLGTWGPPMRLGTRSEIVFITLSPKTV